MSVQTGHQQGERTQQNFNSTHSVSSELYSLLDAVDSESIVDQFEIAREFRYCLEEDVDPTPVSDLSTFRLSVR